MKPHKHAKLIKAWADGAEIQMYGKNEWIDVPKGLLTFSEDYEYRIKPEPRPDWFRYYRVSRDGNFVYPKSRGEEFETNLTLTFDGETGELKSAEVIK